MTAATTTNAAAASAIINAYARSLPRGKFTEFALSKMDKLNVEFWLATLYPENAPSNAGSGYGLTADAARIGAYGELTEVVNANRAIAEMKLIEGCYADLIRQYGTRGIVNPIELCLEVGSDYTHRQTLYWATCERVRTGEKVLVPLDFVACQASDVAHLGNRKWLSTLITNGLGAGLKREDAISHGLLELLQRDGNSVCFRALAKAEAVDLDIVEDAETLDLIRHFKDCAVEIIVKCAATDFDMTNLYVVGYDTDTARASNPSIDKIALLACGEAAHPDREVALRKALLEFAAARSRVAFSHGNLAAVERVAPPGYLKDYLARYDANNNLRAEEARALKVMQGLYRKSFSELKALLDERVFKIDNTIAFSSLPTTTDVELSTNRTKLADEIIARLERAGFDVLVAAYTERDSEVQAVKVIVPGLEVETMSYHRIGERNFQRLLKEKSPLVGFSATSQSDAPDGQAKVLLTKEARARLPCANDTDAWFNVKLAQEIVGDLYALYREPGRHATSYLIDGYKVNNT